MSAARLLCGLLLAAHLIAAAPLEVPFFRQEKNGCGAASVAMVAHYWAARGAAQPAPQPRAVYERLYDAGRHGIALADMRRYLGELGYRAFTFRGAWDDLTEHLAKGRPVIVGLRKTPEKDLHFVVLTGAEEERVWMNDPTRKRPRRVGRNDFEKQWEPAGRWILLATP